MIDNTLHIFYDLSSDKPVFISVYLRKDRNKTSSHCVVIDCHFSDHPVRMLPAYTEPVDFKDYYRALNALHRICNYIRFHYAELSWECRRPALEIYEAQFGEKPVFLV